eukprot:GHVS01000247.1.p1 GENE.GHVS01000247.1~~GHVS01000247.1.p1  ORF type:complete len:213 (+),score=20.53 GHVS01000247.1:236-874(+)
MLLSFCLLLMSSQKPPRRTSLHLLCGHVVMICISFLKDIALISSLIAFSVLWKESSTGVLLLFVCCYFWPLVFGPYILLVLWNYYQSVRGQPKSSYRNRPFASPTGPFNPVAEKIKERGEYNRHYPTEDEEIYDISPLNSSQFWLSESGEEDTQGQESLERRTMSCTRATQASRRRTTTTISAASGVGVVPLQRPIPFAWVPGLGLTSLARG